MTKREFLTASIGAGLALGKGSAAFAQQASSAAGQEGGPSGGNRRVQSRMAKTTKLFKSPEGFPNALDRKSTRLNSSHIQKSRMPSSA